MEIVYDTDRVWVDTPYKNIISYMNENQKGLVKKIVCKDDFILAFSDKKPDIEKYNRYISKCIIESTNKTIGFSTYKTKDSNLNYASEIAINKSKPKCYVQLYAHNYNLDTHNIKKIIELLENHVSENIIENHKPNVITASLIIIVLEHEDKNIDEEDLAKLANTDKPELNLCKNDIIKDFE